jgi:hypothetical protein
MEGAYATLAILLTIVVLFSVIDKIGRGIVLTELISLHGCFVCLIAPLIGYTWYTIDNPLARLWVVYMRVPAVNYYEYVLPAMALFTTVVCWPSTKQNVSDRDEYVRWYLRRAIPILEKNNKIAYQIIIAGILSSALLTFLPSSLRFVASLMFFGSFSGFLYVYFNPLFPRRKLILWGFGLYIFSNGLALGMFTVVAYMGMTIFSFLFLGKKTSLFKKLVFFLLGAFSLLLIQSVKREYRNELWAGYQGNKTILFSNLLVDQITSGKSMFTVDAYFRTYMRTNQGYNVSLVMRRFPVQKDYDNGEMVFKAIAASVVPRALWPDKPMAGGKFNMEYYAGWKIEGWSTDVSPLGEGYGSFGPTGGIIFMGILALFIRAVYFRFFWICRKIPLLLFWLPALFFQVTFSMETDTLQVLNTLVKGSFFLWLLYKFKPEWFGVKRVNKINLLRQNGNVRVG